MATAPFPQGAAGAPLAGYTALYGGSFDPPHLGHQMACLYLLTALGAEEVWLVPTARHAHGKAMQPFAVRLRMLELLAAPLGPRLQICGVEAELSGTSTTYGTVTELSRRHPERRWAVVVGADLVPDLAGWHRAEALFARVGLVVLGRAGAAALAPEGTFPARPWLAAPALPLPEVSSSQLRARLSCGADVTGWLPHAVAQYIRDTRRYRVDAG